MYKVESMDAARHLFLWIFRFGYFVNPTILKSSNFQTRNRSLAKIEHFAVCRCITFLPDIQAIEIAVCGFRQKSCAITKEMPTFVD